MFLIGKSPYFYDGCQCPLCLEDFLFAILLDMIDFDLVGQFCMPGVTYLIIKSN